MEVRIPVSWCKKILNTDSWFCIFTVISASLLASVLVVVFSSWVFNSEMVMCVFSALYAPAQSHALAKQKLSSSSLKRPHSQISIPQHPFPSRQPHPNPSPVVPKKPLPELKRCPSTQASPSGSSQTSAVPITVPNLSRSHMTPPTLTLPLAPTSPGGSLLATKQLLRIALSSASASASAFTQCTNGQSKSSTMSPSHDLVQPKPQLSPASAKPECPIPSPQNSNTCPQLVQLSPSRQTWTSPQRASPPSPVLPLVSTSSTTSPAPPQSPLTSITHTTDMTKELKSAKPKPGNGTEEIPQDLKLPSSQTKSVEGNQTSQSASAEPQPSGTTDKPAVIIYLFVYRWVQKFAPSGKVREVSQRE